MKTTTVAALLALAAASGAAGPAGAWTGRFLPKTPVLPAGAPPAQKAKLAAELKMVQTGRMHLAMKPNGTYTMHIVGLPMLGKPDSTGTWRQSGAFVEMVQTGAPAGARPLRLAYTQKKMTLQLGPGTRFEFTR